MNHDNRNEFVIRAARADELERLVDIEIDAFYAIRDAGGVDGEPVATSLEKLADALNDDLLFVAADRDDVAIGFLAAEIVGDELYIGEVDVLRAFQGKGAGRRLVLRAIAEAEKRNMRRVTLTTDRLVPFNAPFYATLGFSIATGEGLSPHLRANLERQVGNGLDAARRVGMVLVPSGQDGLSTR